MIRILRPTGTGTLISGRVFDDQFARNLYPELFVHPVELGGWLHSIFGNEPIAADNPATLRAFRSATGNFDFLCPNYVAIPATPLLLYLRNRSRAPIRLLLIAHAPGVYPLEWALLRPLLRRGDLIIAPSQSAQETIGFLMPELAAYVRLLPHPIQPLPRFHAEHRRNIVSLTRMHPSKLLHRQIEAMALLRNRRNVAFGMRIAGPIHEPGAQEAAPYARSLLAMLSRLKLEDCVELVGEIDDDTKKGKLLAEATLLVNLSVTIEESFGKAIVEALGAGVPVLATQWNGFPETVGAGGRCVPVDATLVGTDVPAERIADAIERLLEAPPSSEVCRREALRFHPRRVRRLYRQALEAAIEASAAGDPASGRSPEPEVPATPRDGLLASTAPLEQYSWRELFEIHIQDVENLRASRASHAQRDASEADELRSLLIVGIRAPLGRWLAGASLNGMDRPVGTPHPGMGAAGFGEKIAHSALSRATVSSRLACLSLLAHRRRLAALRRGLKTMRADGIRSWGNEHFEIEALRLEGKYKRAFQMSIERRDPLYWGDLATDRLHQLATVCRDWGRPKLALPYLRKWLERFPDSPESGTIHLDRCASAMALAEAAPEEARRALESARQLLGESGEVASLEVSMQRIEALKRELACRAVTERVGRIRSLTPIGRSTFLVEASQGKFVLKQMRGDRDPTGYFDVLARLAKKQPRFCPYPSAALVAGNAYWYALFEWVEGHGSSSFDLDDNGVRSAVDLLRRLADCDVVPKWRLESIWLDRLQQHVSDEPAAAFILDRLRRAMPTGQPTLAHGDFAPQNFVRCGSKMLLVDWEEIGSSPPGFDAGWMLAHARLGVGVQPYESMLGVLRAAGFRSSNLRWFERLGLLRLLFRVRALATSDGPSRQVRVAVERAVEECAAAIGWRGSFSEPAHRVSGQARLMTSSSG